VLLEDFDLFRSFFAVTERVQGLSHLRIFDRASHQPLHEISFPEPAYRAAAESNAEFDATTYRYSYQSLVTPASVYQFSVATGQSALLKQAEIPGGFDRSLYASERIPSITVVMVAPAAQVRTACAPLPLIDCT
jgi:oligopeptidase B